MALFDRGKSDDPLVLMQQGQFKEAVKLLQAKLRRTPHDFSLKMRLAEALEGAGKKDEASRLYVAEGEAVLQEGDRNKGLALLKKAARLFPEDAALKEKILHLEGVPQQSGEDAFSFDVEVGEETAGGEPEPAQAAPAEIADRAPAEPEATEEDALEIEMDLAPGQEAETPELSDLPRETLSPPASSDAPAEPSGGPGDLEAGEPENSETSQRDFPALEDHLPLIRALFPELSEEEAVLLDLVAAPVYLEAGDVLVREQEEGDSLFIVARGRMEARGRFESGVMTLAVLSAGDLVGEVAFLKKVPRTATVTAIEPSLVLELPAEETRARLAGHPEAMENLERILQERVERTLALLKEHIRKEHGD